MSHVRFFFRTKWWSLLVEGLLSTGPTPSSFNNCLKERKNKLMNYLLLTKFESSKKCWLYLICCMTYYKYKVPKICCSKMVTGAVKQRYEHYLDTPFECKLFSIRLHLLTKSTNSPKSAWSHSFVKMRRGGQTIVSVPNKLWITRACSGSGASWILEPYLLCFFSDLLRKTLSYWQMLN